MKLLFDQNISHKVLKYLSADFSNSTTIKKEILLNANDRAILMFAKKNDFTIVTHDSDFHELISILGFPPKVIWFRVGNLSTQSIANLLNTNYNKLETFNMNNSLGVFQFIKPI